MGWVESPPYFCAALETARDVAVDYIETSICSLPAQKIEDWAGAKVAQLQKPSSTNKGFWYVVEVYVDDFIAAIIPTTREQITHVAQGILHGIHDVFPVCNDDNRDPISTKKLRKGEGTFHTKNAFWDSNLKGQKKRYGSRKINEQRY
jgi:hypothetical protein